MYEHDSIRWHETCLNKIILKSYYNIRIHYETMKKLDLRKKTRLTPKQYYSEINKVYGMIINKTMLC